MIIKKLITIVDMQNDFVQPNGKLPVTGAASLIEPFNKFIRRASFDAAVATFDTHNKHEYKKSEEAKLFPIHCVKGTPGWELAVNMPYMYRSLEKSIFDMWPENPELPTFAPQKYEVFVVGVAADYCVKYAVQGFLDRGYQTTVFTDLTRGIQREFDQVANEDFAKYLASGQLRLMNSAKFQR